MSTIKPKRPTQVDVALRAGVSRATVSLVLNQTGGPVPIGEETRERVLAAAREIGYAPNPVAQMLARGSNHIIGFLSFDDIFLLAESDFYYPYLVGVQREAGEQNYHLLLLRNNSSVFENGMNSLLLADGSIVTGTDPDSGVLRQLAQENYPFVLLGECDSLKGYIDNVQSDHEPASYAATRHLLEMHHRNLGIVVEEMSLPHHRQRLSGCERAISEVSGARLTILNSKDLISPKKFATSLHKHQITALLCAERNLTHPTINLIQQLPLRIPEDLSIVFLSTTWGVPFDNPTRVNLNRDLAGQIAVQRLIQRLEGHVEGFQQILVPCDFVSGDSTGAVNP